MASSVQEAFWLTEHDDLVSANDFLVANFITFLQHVFPRNDVNALLFLFPSVLILLLDKHALTLDDCCTSSDGSFECAPVLETTSCCTTDDMLLPSLLLHIL